MRELEELFLDTETTGLSNLDEILSIAIVDQQKNVLLSTYVTPVIKRSWPDAQAVNKISPEFIFAGNYPTFLELISQIREIVAEKEVIIYNSEYDTRMMRNAGLPLFHYCNLPCCMHAFSRFMGEEVVGYRNQMRYKRHSLIKAAEHVGHVWDGNPHGALADALACRSVWNYLKIHDTRNSYGG